MGTDRTSDAKWERKLGIFTGAADYEKEDANHSRYEPTSYAVLERLAASSYIRREDVVVDYGCGKGRVGFFLNHVLGCGAVGVDFNAELIVRAQANVERYAARNGEGRKLSFICTSAESYVPCTANRFYFFNPFSVRILQSVLGRIFESYYSAPRDMYLFFYYAVDDYRSCLLAQDGLEFIEEIDCRDLFFNDDPKETILVFRIGSML